MSVVLRPVAPTPLPEALARLEHVVSPITGIVRRLHEPLPTPAEPDLSRVAAETTQGCALLAAPLDHLREGTGGAGTSRAAAVAAAVGEAAERYSAAYVPEEALIRAAAVELGTKAVPPERFALFSERQYARPDFPFVAFESETRVTWVEGFSLPDCSSAYLPAQLVYLRDPRLTAVEPLIGYTTSNGLACAPTLEEAVLAGLLEALERDAFLLTWSGRLSLPRLDWSTHVELAAFDERYFARTRARYSVIDLSVFHRVPTALGVVRASPPAPAIAVGAGCAPTVEEAWQKALAESFAVQTWARALLLRESRREFAADFSDVQTFADHVRFHADAAWKERASFLDASRNTRSVSDVAPLEGGNVRCLIEMLAARVNEAGECAYAVDVTSPDVREAGLRVAKVIVPGFCQLDAHHRYRFLGGERRLTAAWRLGLRDAPFAPEELNDDPHPFP